MQRDVPKARRFRERADEERAHGSARLRLMDLYCRHFFKRFRNTFETRRAFHFSKILVRVWASQKIAIDSPHTNDFELNRDPLAQVSHIRNIVHSCALDHLKTGIDNHDVNFLQGGAQLHLRTYVIRDSGIRPSLDILHRTRQKLA